MNKIFLSIKDRSRITLLRWINNRGLWEAVRQVNQHAAASGGLKTRLQKGDPAKPVAFFNASTRLTGISLNAAFSYLAGLSLQLAGVPVVRFACRAGMSRCVLGTNRADFTKAPPCGACQSQSQWLFSDAPTVWFDYQPDNGLRAALQGLNIEQLSSFTQKLSVPGSQGPDECPLGLLVLPSIRWVLRRHHLADDEKTRMLYREYILSAYRVFQEFSKFLDQADPAVLVVFNGMFFPEATARWAARQRGVRVVSHEVGFKANSAFFTDGEATAYPIEIPKGFQLSQAQEARLDEYLEQRFQGQFTMAGIRFWPEMSGLEPDFLARAANFRQLVPIFTNVVFDTSQPHSNVLYPHMFAWLDQLLEIFQAFPDTLFVLRAHPDEMRKGKESQESVQEWVEQNQVLSLPNVVFFDSHQRVSSYELIQRAKFVMIYNSTIGLEASIMGAAVLCAGKARFTQYPTVFFPPTAEAYRRQAETFLESTQPVTAPVEHRKNARSFLYYQLYKTSLPFDEFLEEDGIWPGFVRLRRFPWQNLLIENSETMRVIVEGLRDGKPFLLDEPSDGGPETALALNSTTATEEGK